jgi:regulator of PEP synthase PpsR (kinase-PPPase family)
MPCAYNQGMKIHHVFIVSNATGLSAETTARASLAQFKLEANSTKFHLFARCSSTKEFEQIVIDAKECGGLIVYTLGDALWAELLADLSEKHGVPALDLLTPVVALMARTFNLEPTQANLPHHHLTEDARRYRIDWCLEKLQDTAFDVPGEPWVQGGECSAGSWNSTAQRIV